MADANIIVKIVDQTRGGVGSVTTQIDKLGTSAGSSQTKMSGLTKAVGGLAAALSVRAFVEFGDTVQSINNRIALINPELGTAAENFQRISEIAQTTFSPLEATADLFQKIARSAEEYNLTGEQVGVVTETFTNLLRLASADAAAADGAIRQLGQALGSGALRGDEFNSIVEATAGEILPLLAEELGVSAGQVRELAADGKITGEVLINALGGAADETTAKVDQMGVTIGQSLVYLQNSFLELGSEASPVFDTLAQGIILVADNLDVVVVAAGAMLAAFAVSTIASIVTSIGTITVAVKALTVAMLANPVTAVFAAMTLAITGIYVYWDELKDLVVGVFNSMRVAGLEFVKYLTEGLEATINGLINGFENFGTKTIAVMKAIGKSILDPTNATEIFREELAKAEAQIAANTDKTVDFSDTIESLDRRIVDATKSTEDNTDETDSNTDAKSDNEDQTEDTEDATRNFRIETDDTTDALDKNVQALQDQYKAYAESRAAADRATAAVQAHIQEIENETQQLGISQDERDELIGLIELENEKRQALGDDIEDLTAAEIAQIGDLTDIRDAATLDLLQLTDDEVQAYLDAQQAFTDKVDSIDAESERQKTIQRSLSDFTRDTESLNRSYYEATTSEIQQLEDEKQDYIRRARELGLEDERSTQDAILEYNRQINKEIAKSHEDMIEEQKRQIQDFKGEYNLIYDDIYDKIEEWTGLSSRELEKYNQYAKLLLGVDILGSVDNFVTQGLMGIQGFNILGSSQMQDFAYNSALYTGNAGNYIGNDIFGQYLPGQVGGFVGAAGTLFGANGGGLLGLVTGLFGGLGGTLTDLFSYVFGGIGSGLSGVGNIIGNIFGAGFDFLGGLGSSIINIGSDFFGGIFDFFGGLFADGGYVKPGTFGIVGEQGPEIIRGPAEVYSNEDSMGMMGGGGPVNVNFTINAVDSKSIDQLLVDRKPLITNIVRNAVAQQGRRF